MAETTNTTKKFDNVDTTREYNGAAEESKAEAGNANAAAENAASGNTDADADSSAKAENDAGRAEGAENQKPKPSFQKIQAEVFKEFGLSNFKPYSRILEMGKTAAVPSIISVEKKIQRLKGAILDLDPAAYDFSVFIPTALESKGFDLDKFHLIGTLKKSYSRKTLQNALTDLQSYATNLGRVLVQLRVADENSIPMTVEDISAQMRLSKEPVESTLVNIPVKPYIPEEVKKGNLVIPEKPVMPDLTSLSESDRTALEGFLSSLGTFYSEVDKVFGAVGTLQDLVAGLSSGWDTIAETAEKIAMQNVRIKARFDSSSEQSRYVNGDAQPDGDGTEGDSPEGNKGDGRGRKGEGKDPNGKENKDSGDSRGSQETTVGNGPNPKTGYGTKGGNRKSKGCGARRTAKLRSVSVTHGEKTKEELMELFHITDPAELAKVQKYVCNATREVIVIPAVKVVIIHKFTKYSYEGEWCGGGSAGSFKLMNGSECSVDMMAHILDMATFQHMPYYRVHKEMSSWQYNVGKDAIPRWVQVVSFEYLEVFYRMLIKKVLSLSHIHVDETFFKVVHDGRGRGTESYLWIASRGELLKDVPPMTVYIYDETRSTNVLRCNFGDFHGTMTCDGLGDYPLYEKERKDAKDPITISCCWTHVRRKFAGLCRIFKSYCKDKAKRKKNPYCWCFDQCNKIIHKDAGLSGLPPGERLAKRHELIEPLVKEFFDYIMKYKDAKGDFGKAVNYALGLETQLRVFLGDPFVPATNSHAERSALFFGLSRNAFRQIDSIDGALATAIIHSIAATADANGVNGFLYFRYLLEKLPGLVAGHGKPVGGKPYDYSYLEALLPWGDDYKAYEERMLGLYGDAGKAYAAALYESLGEVGLKVS